MFKIKIFAVAVGLFVFTPDAVRAQTEDKKFEVGGQFSMLWVPAQTVTTSGATSAITTGREAKLWFWRPVWIQRLKIFHAGNRRQFLSARPRLGWRSKDPGPLWSEGRQAI